MKEGTNVTGCLRLGIIMPRLLKTASQTFQDKCYYLLLRHNSGTAAKPKRK